MELEVVSYRNSTSNHNGPAGQFSTKIVVSYRNSTSNHNYGRWHCAFCWLYLIEILHQTTTVVPRTVASVGCILSKFYIKPQRMAVDENLNRCCILSKFYIKPQHPALKIDLVQGCILSKFYIKPQHLTVYRVSHRCCILSKFYIKPQLDTQEPRRLVVVSYRNSTSNHNYSVFRANYEKVVSYRNSTSNHNFLVAHPMAVVLYLIEILHQTTTSRTISLNLSPLYLIEILHQTTTPAFVLVRKQPLYLIEILHQTTTKSAAINRINGLYLIEILHQTTT